MGWSDLETEFSRPAEMSGLIFVTWQCTSDELAGWKCERSRTLAQFYECLKSIGAQTNTASL